ncbi:MAG: Sir2 family NAD-dependent protein deacetylase [Mucinivorans sp.]
MKKIVVFTGAGVSADSGIATFRDSDGLWAHYRIEDVCTPEALARNRSQVIDFYNQRRREMLRAEPNDGHRAIVTLSTAENIDLQVVTQNIDNLHERAAAQLNLPLRVTHLHGELTKLRSSRDENATVALDGWEQKLDTRHPDGSLLRPFVVFFGESVPQLSRAIEIVSAADVMIIVGTSLAVYPAASLVRYLRSDVPIYVVDPGQPSLAGIHNPVSHIKANSAIGLPQLVDQLITTLSPAAL